MKRAGSLAAGLALLLGILPVALARDTDIYSVNAKQNCYILLDSSGSMAWGVYEHTIDYGAMYDYFYTLNDTAVPVYDYIKDPVSGGALLGAHSTRQKIYLVTGDPGVTIANVGGTNIAFTGDPGNPSVSWSYASKIDTHTLVDENGDLSDDGTGLRRLTVDAGGYVLLDGVQLPLGMNVKLHDLTTLGSLEVDNGFGGVLNAPGFYFSGYEGIDTSLPYTANDQAESGDQNIYFFATGNWVNMQAVYNLDYNVNPPGAAGSGDPAWQYEPYPIGTASWTTVGHILDYPNGAANYTNNLTEAATSRTISHPGALKIRVHFSAFNVQGNSNATTFTKDYVKIYSGTNVLMAQYDNDNKPTTTGGWSPTITGNTAIIKLKSDGSTTASGYTIDKIAVVYEADETGEATYLMQSRLDVAKDAMLYVVEEFRGKMNWGFASFGNNATGAQIGPFLNPTDNDDTQRQAIAQQVANVTASGGTPLMEALEDVFDDGYYGRRNVLDDLLCRKNYVISMTDGFPSADDDNTRISGVTFGDWDGDGWTQDPSQYAHPNPDYYDDVAHWMYTHSWMDKSVVADPANSYENVSTHHISFGAKHPLLQNAAEGADPDDPQDGSGGVYITAYNKEQLVAAFTEVTNMMTRSVSFTAPVVSLNAANKIENGDDLYMGLFLPMDNSYWVGNLKKFKLGDGSVDRPKPKMIYGNASEAEALNSDDTFKDDTVAFWGDDNDTNDSNNEPTAEIKEDGAGEVLLEDVAGYFAAGTYWNRPIYTYKGGAMTKFDQANITPTDLGLVATDNATRNKLVNFTHGYTYAADADTGAPLAKKDWVLGPIIHSRPVVVDYYDTAVTGLPLLQRYVAVGSNDGMLHVFDETTGREVFAFIPDDILPKLQNVEANNLYDTVDGLITLYRRDKNPKYLIFGERRGGGAYWCLDVSSQDPANWTVAWKYVNVDPVTGQCAEMCESWSGVETASIPVGITTAGARTYKDVAVFTAGYDAEEDNFPEPFNDVDLSGSPYNAGGALDANEWKQADATQDVYENNLYDKYNPAMNETGRAIFVVDIDDPTNIVLNGAAQVLPFSVRYGAATLATGAAQTMPEMKFCFPATPSLVGATDKYIYADGLGALHHGYKTNVLRALYAIDVYANLFKVWYDFEVINAGTIASPLWSVSKAAWNVKRIFAANPASTIGSGRMGGVDDPNDQGRKAFYPPDISWGGTEKFFVARNYYFPNTTFAGTTGMASLFFGTGDREHPKYTMIRNRVYALYDDSAVTAKEYAANGILIGDVAVSSAPYTEKSLLNLTCDELGIDSTVNNCYLGALGAVCPGTPANIDYAMKSYLKTELKDDATYNTPALALERGAAQENDAKGWYIVLGDQGTASACGHVDYVATSIDDHTGEKVLSKLTLFNGVLYFTTYQPAGGDACNPQGNIFYYALNYDNGTAALNLNPTNDSADEEKAKVKDVSDRWDRHEDSSGIGTNVEIIFRDGEAYTTTTAGDETLIRDALEPPLGLQLYYWRDSNSMQP